MLTISTCTSLYCMCFNYSYMHTYMYSTMHGCILLCNIITAMNMSTQSDKNAINISLVPDQPFTNTSNTITEGLFDRRFTRSSIATPPTALLGLHIGHTSVLLLLL